MKWRSVLSLLACLFSLALCAQQVTVSLTEYARDDRFERFNLNLALFEVKNDTILTWDFEGLKTAEPLQIKKPSGFNYYAYGYVFFAANGGSKSPGFLTILVGNPYHKNPSLFADLNNNNDFTDDGEARLLPWRGDTAVHTFCIAQTNRCATVKFTRHVVDGKFEYKRLMNEYYQFTYPDRKFIGMEHCYREQQYQAKAGVLKLDGDSVRVAIFDANNNGVFNEPDSDKLVLANLSDTLIYPFDDLYSSTISKKAGLCFVDKNGRQFEFVEAAPDGSWINLLVKGRGDYANQIKKGKKLPRFKYITHKGEKIRIRKLNRYQLYLYFGNPQSASFSADTAALRELMTNFGSTLRVVGFIEVQKSYELSIIGQYGHLNWILAHKDKNLNRALGIRGIPSSIYTRKRRRVVQYNLSPAELLEQLKQQKAK